MYILTYIMHIIINQRVTNMKGTIQVELKN